VTGESYVIFESACSTLTGKGTTAFPTSATLSVSIATSAFLTNLSLNSHRGAQRTEMSSCLLGPMRSEAVTSLQHIESIQVYLVVPYAPERAQPGHFRLGPTCRDERNKAARRRRTIRSPSPS